MHSGGCVDDRDGLEVAGCVSLGDAGEEWQRRWKWLLLHPRRLSDGCFAVFVTLPKARQRYTIVIVISSYVL